MGDGVAVVEVTALELIDRVFSAAADLLQGALLLNGTVAMEVAVLVGSPVTIGPKMLLGASGVLNAKRLLVTLSVLIWPLSVRSLIIAVLAVTVFVDDAAMSLMTLSFVDAVVLPIPFLETALLPIDETGAS